MVNGLPMGGCLSVNVSGILLNNVLNIAVNKWNKSPKLILKYIDDILVITNKKDVNEFLDILNNSNTGLIFTKELEQNNQIRFLDINIHRDTNYTLTTSWCKKTSTSNRILNWHSNHDTKQKINTAINLINKSKKLTDKIHLNSIKTQIYNILLDNWYPIRLINKLWHNTNKSNKINTPPIDNNTHIQTDTQIKREPNTITKYFKPIIPKHSSIKKDNGN